MHLKLTWRIKGRKDIDIMVTAQQTIYETMNILVESGYMEEDIVKKTKYIKSLRTKTQVNVLLTYKEAKIYSGDILEFLTM